VRRVALFHARGADAAPPLTIDSTVAPGTPQAGLGSQA
jgi:hypothetical protein